MDITISLVRATADDAQDYIRIARLSISQFNTATTVLEEVVREIEGSMVYMIKIESLSVGFVSYVMQEPNHAYISEVQVERDFRSKGIGGQALAIILRELAKVEIVDLYTHPANPAQRLYCRLGFVATEERVENHHGTGEPRMRMLLVRA